LETAPTRAPVRLPMTPTRTNRETAPRTETTVVRTLDCAKRLRDLGQTSKPIESRLAPHHKDRLSRSLPVAPARGLRRSFPLAAALPCNRAKAFAFSLMSYLATGQDDTASDAFGKTRNFATSNSLQDRGAGERIASQVRTVAAFAVYRRGWSGLRQGTLCVAELSRVHNNYDATSLS
jgi:hypothetical protein